MGLMFHLMFYSLDHDQVNGNLFYLVMHEIRMSILSAKRPPLHKCYLVNTSAELEQRTCVQYCQALDLLQMVVQKLAGDAQGCLDDVSVCEALVASGLT